MEWDDEEETVLAVEAKITHPFKKDGTVTVGIVPVDRFTTFSDFESYCLKNARTFFIEFLSPRLLEWMNRLAKACVPRACLMTSFHTKVAVMARCIDEFFAHLCGGRKDVEQRVRVHCVEWLLPTAARHIFTGHMTRVCTFSLYAYYQSVDIFLISVLPTKYLTQQEGADIFSHSLDMLRYVAALLNSLRAAPSKYPVDDPFMYLSIRNAMFTVGQSVMVLLCENVVREGTTNFRERTNRELMQWTRLIPFTIGPTFEKEFGAFMERATIDCYVKRIYALCIQNFPKTYNDVESLRFCMRRHCGYGREKIISNLNYQINRRLLHIGATTSSILNSYAAAVDSLRQLDPSCFIMHRVCSNIKIYLKKRNDTVRQIISFITNSGNNLNRQLMKRRRTIVDEEEAAGVNDEFLGEEEGPSLWRRWNPDPPDALNEKANRFQRSADVFTMLVSVYGSKESFVKEYRQLLAERLTQGTRDPAFETRYLDLLKQRFTEGELQQCEVMLKDVRDSEILDQEILLCEKMTVPVSVRVISSYFWPKVDNDKVVEFPPVLESGLHAYEEEYQLIKPDRKLNYLRAAGCVELSMCIDGVYVDKIVSNANAAVIYLFLEKESWTPSELAERLQIGRGAALKRLEWWKVQGVLIHVGADDWALTTQASNIDRFSQSQQEPEEDAESDEGETADAGDVLEDLEQYWTYTSTFIQGQEQKEVRAERLFSIYKMFGLNLSLEHVVMYLQRKVRENLLSFNNGFYRVVAEQAGEGSSN